MFTIKELAKQISSIRKSSSAFREAVQQTLIGCAYFAMKDGNITPFNELLDAVGDGTRKKGITAWAELFAPVYIKNEKFTYSKRAAQGIVVNDEKDFEAYRAEMIQVNWWEIVAKEKVESVWDAGDYLERVAGTLRKHGVDESIVRLVADAEMAARIKKSALEEMAEVEVEVEVE